jgi:plasmid stabilization system protein ParE
MTYRIEPTAQAVGDIERIFDWLSARSLDGATRWYESFWDATERLEHFPRSCALAAESSKLPEEVRCMLFGTPQGRTYRALFAIRGDAVHILCVRGPGEKNLTPTDIHT